MTKFLLDTNVLSEFSRGATPPNASVQRWVESIDSEFFYTSVLSFGEIRKGVMLLPPSKKRAELEQWLEAGLRGWFGQNLLPVTGAISNRWGILAALSQIQGKPLGTTDGLIAATAFEHGLTVATRNTRHFENLGVPLVDPWDDSAA